MKSLSIEHMKDLSKGPEIGDKVILIPAFGPQREIVLNRTCYQVSEKSGGTLSCAAGVWSFPSFLKKKYHFSLELLALGLSGRVYLKMTSANPIKVNGTWCFEAVLEWGSSIFFGHNQIYFPPLDHEIPEERIPFNGDVLRSKIPVLLTGETGSGKSYLAKKIHEGSSLSGKFVHLNLSAFSKDLIESELFGHCVGAFSGAICERKGAIKSAQGGTLFLDEIDSTSIELQTKLLLFLDSGRYRPVGGDVEIKSDARVIFASGRALRPLVTSGKMRKDFYFRISSGIQHELGPLRKNPDLLRSICQKICGKQNRHISGELVSIYQKYFWPGNIRELIGHLNKKCALSKGVLEIDQLDRDLFARESVEKNETSIDAVVPFQQFKRAYFLSIVVKFKGNILGASKALRVSPNTIRSTLKYNQLEIIE